MARKRVPILTIQIIVTPSDKPQVIDPHKYAIVIDRRKLLKRKKIKQSPRHKS
jgi:hypothetical protein